MLIKYDDLKVGDVIVNIPYGRDASRGYVSGKVSEIIGEGEIYNPDDLSPGKAVMVNLCLFSQNGAICYDERLLVKGDEYEVVYREKEDE